MKRLHPIILLALAAVASCSDLSGPVNEQTADLNAARARWKSQNLHTYGATLQTLCFCANTDRLLVVVVNDAVVGAFDLDAGQYVDLARAKSVDQLFDTIQDAIAQRAAQLTVQYDATAGFPSQTNIDYKASVADDEVTYAMSNVHPITPQVAQSLTESRLRSPRGEDPHRP